jgi:hypothetical protein
MCGICAMGIIILILIPGHKPFGSSQAFQKRHSKKAVQARVGAPTWLSVIVVFWGFCAAAMCAMKSSSQFMLLRFILGLLEAGTFPGIWCVSPRSSASSKLKEGVQNIHAMLPSCHPMFICRDASGSTSASNLSTSGLALRLTIEMSSI